jgi:hypothetical protein
MKQGKQNKAHKKEISEQDRSKQNKTHKKEMGEHRYETNPELDGR